MSLTGKKILLGVTGSIAAYKAAEIVRLLIKEGAHVKVIMTPDSRSFIGTVTLSALSKNKVLVNFFNAESGEWNNHVELGLWADLFIIAPITSNTISKFAHGACDNLLSAAYLSARCPVVIAPAMDHDMYNHPSTTKNLAELKSCGVEVIYPESGELASGLSGDGRLQEPQIIVDRLNVLLSKERKQSLKHKKILVTAGPTREAIDPVRFISNHSSGKMGVAIALELSKRGGEVTLITGPGVNTSGISSQVKVMRVTSANEMYQTALKEYSTSQVTVMAAAVADYTPAVKSLDKIKKSGTSINIEMETTKDILGEMGNQKKVDQILVGFALETNNELENAVKKLKNKNLDFIVLNSLNDPGAGFNTETNKITIIDRQEKTTEFPLKSKTEVAYDIAEKIEKLIQ